MEYSGRLTVAAMLARGCEKRCPKNSRKEVYPLNFDRMFSQFSGIIEPY
jgi:hypothetical protein